MAVSSRRVNAQTRREFYELHAVLCKAIADPKRLLIINALRDGPKTVTEGGFLMDSREQLRAMRAMEDADLELLLKAGVSVVAEAAFRDKVWRPRLEPLQSLAEFRIIHCRADPAVVRERIADRALRAAHADAAWVEQREREPEKTVFEPLTWASPSLTVDTTHGYVPNLDEVLAFVIAH